MKIATWNVNGLRAVCGKGFVESFERLDADILCLQETKLQAGQIDLSLEGYESYWSYAERKGYSGTAIFTRRKPDSVVEGVDTPGMNGEGRVLTADFGTFYVVDIYSPNSQSELARIDYRLRWEEALRRHVARLDADKPVLLCGDMNVARHPIDLYRPESNEGSAGYSAQERDAFEQLLGSGFTDLYRMMYPDRTEAYTWWSYMRRAREKNHGWRIDYILASDRISPLVRQVTIHSDITGSDHCPVSADLAL